MVFLLRLKMKLMLTFYGFSNFFLYFYCCRRLQHIRSYSTTIFSRIVKIYHYGSYIGHQDHLSKLKGLFGDVDLGQSKWIVHHILCNSIGILKHYTIGRSLLTIILRTKTREKSDPDYSQVIRLLGAVF